MIPVPDPTPDEPEPIRIEEVEVPDLVPEDMVGDFGVPDRPRDSVAAASTRCR